MIIILHVTAGLTALIAGAVALFAAKGARLHRRSGMLFVYAMLVMSASGATIALIRAQPANVIAGSLTFYLVVTAWLTVRRPAVARWIDLGALFGALAVVTACILFAVGVGGVESEEIPAPFFIGFGAVALLAALGDARRLLTRRLPEAQRLARHVWRMCLALFVAAGSFFLGQADLFPAPVRSSGLLALPVLLVVVLMVFWLARVLFTPWRPRA